MIRKRKTSKKPSEAFIGHFQHQFADVIQQPDTDDGHPIRLQEKPDKKPARENVPLRGDHQGVMNIFTHDTPGVEIASSVIDIDLDNLVEPTTQLSVSQDFNRCGRDPLFSNLAGDLHTPKPSLPTNVAPISPSGFSETRSGCDHFDLQAITGQTRQISFHAKNSYHAQNLFARRLTTLNELGSESLRSSPKCKLLPDETAFKEVTSSESLLNSTFASESNNFRFIVALDAPTAMVEYPKTCESYLNKGHTYLLKVIDKSPWESYSRPPKYRTSIRISFENEEQRSNPAYFWQLWADCQSSKDVSGDRLSAVEYIPPEGAKANMDYDIQLEQTSVDGFCVIWSAKPIASLVYCPIFMRFNFMSTDFSRSKGVKGMTLRLCAKTEVLSTKDTGIERASELCYCKIRAFRDHGAERKLANDITHVKRAIKKLQGDLALAEAELETGLGRRKRRRKSLDGAAEVSSLKDDIQLQLSGKQKLLESAHSISSLNQRGDEDDDPDLFPVQLPASAKVGPRAANCQDRKNNEIETMDMKHHACNPKDQSLSKQELIACFFVRFPDAENDLYRAIYLTERTAQDLTRQICDKCHINPSHVVRMICINKTGLHILVDDDVVRELPESQGIVVEVENSPRKSGGDVGINPTTEIRLKY